MIFPTSSGDTVALISPSSPLTEQEPVEAIAAAIAAAGYRVWTGESTRGAEPDGYAAPVEARVRDIHRAFSDPRVRAVWCTRGGGTAWRLLERLDWDLIAANPKPFIGFSDVTTLHTAIAQRCGLVTFHGPTANRLLQWGPEDFSWGSLRRALEMGGCLAIENPPGEPVLCLRPGRAEGLLTGGNLSLIAAGVGTPWQIDARGKILYLEDVGEAVYALERMLYQLRYAGILHQAAGIILGAFTDCRNARREDYGPEAMVRDFFRGFPRPVLLNLRSAHTHPMVTLPLGTVCCMDAGAGSVVCRRGGGC